MPFSEPSCEDAASLVSGVFGNIGQKRYSIKFGQYNKLPNGIKVRKLESNLKVECCSGENVH